MTNGAAGTARHTTSTVIKLDGAAIGILRDLIVEAFDNADLEQLVRTKLNIGLYDEVAKNQPLRKLVFDLLEVLERRGTTRFLLRATWDARPFNDHFRNGIERLFPGVRETPPSPAEEANMVADGLRSLKDQLGNPAVYTVVSSYRDDLSRLMDEIDVLANYKALHDYLQRIQLQLYPHMVDRVKRFSTDLSAGQELEYHIATLKEICKGAREKAEALPNTAAVQAEQLQWVVILEAAAAELRQTVAALDELRALQALRSLRQVIRNEPFRVNTLLTWTAEKLPLEQLIKTIDEVIKALPVGGDSASDMKGPLQSLQNLLARLGGRVVEHKQWQGIENEFWEAEEFVEKGTPESAAQFIQLWPDAKARAEALWKMSPEADWAIEARDLAALIDNGADNREVTRSVFKRFRIRLFSHFYEVDKALKTQCDAILAIRSPLGALLSKA